MATSIYGNMTPHSRHFHVVFDVASCLLNLSIELGTMLNYFIMKTHTTRNLGSKGGNQKRPGIQGESKRRREFIETGNTRRRVKSRGRRNSEMYLGGRTLGGRKFRGRTSNPRGDLSGKSRERI